MPRLFTGLEIPQSQRLQMSLLQTGLKNVRWIEPSDFHITLRFIGDVSIHTANAIVEIFDTRNWIAPEIQLGELNAFGNDKPRSIYASIKENEQLMNLVQSQERLLQSTGLKAESRKFTPHVTLCRTRGGTSTEAIASYLGQFGGFVAPAFSPSRFVLYSAKESTGGGPYRIEQSWTFQNNVQ